MNEGTIRSGSYTLEAIAKFIEQAELLPLVIG
jgi:hypothetical protein